MVESLSINVDIGNVSHNIKTVCLSVLCDAIKSLANRNRDFNSMLTRLLNVGHVFDETQSCLLTYRHRHNLLEIEMKFKLLRLAFIFP